MLNRWTDWCWLWWWHSVRLGAAGCKKVLILVAVVVKGDVVRNLFKEAVYLILILWQPFYQLLILNLSSFNII